MVHYRLMDDDVLSDPKARESAKLYIELQHLLMGICMDDFESTKSFLSQSVFIKSREGGEILARNIFFAARFRAMKIELLSELVLFIHKATNNDNFKNFLMDLFFEPSFHDEFSYKETWRYCFLYHCLQKNVYSQEEVVDRIKNFESSSAHYGQAQIIRAWFLPEIEKIDKELYSYYLCENMVFNGSEENETRVFDVLNTQNLVEPLIQDDFLLLKRCREFGYTVDNELIAILINDDVNSLQKLTAMPDFDIDQIIEPSLFSRSAILQDSSTPIAFSAAFGSVECFKFLLLNKASLEFETWNDVSTTLASFAVAGGNTEIVRLVEQENCSFDSAIYVSVQYHQNSIFYWLYQKLSFEIDKSDALRYGTLMHRAAKSNNVEIALFCIDHNCNINHATENRFF